MVKRKRKEKVVRRMKRDVSAVVNVVVSAVSVRKRRRKRNGKVVRRRKRGVSAAVNVVALAVDVRKRSMMIFILCPDL